jgi:AcrR family transcriptional regulator
MNNAKPAGPRLRRTKAEQSALEAEVVRISLQLFIDGGEDAVSMRKIASEVGVAPMSLYRYFPSKAHLMRHIWQDLLSQACARGQLEAAVVEHPLGRLRAFVNGFLCHWLDNRHQYWFVFCKQSAPCPADGLPEDEPIRPDLRELLELLSGMLAACSGAATETSPAHQQLAEELFCSAIGFLLASVGLGLKSPGDIANLMARMLDGMEARVQAELAAVALTRGSGGR